MSEDATAAQHDHLSEAVQELVGLDPEITEGSFLVGYTLIAEFADPDGTRWFVSRQGDVSGPNLYPWTEEGYLRRRLRAIDVCDRERFTTDDSDSDADD